jgi:hypothetical protein
MLLVASLAFAQEEPEITRYLNLTAEDSCPGNLLDVKAIASDGSPAFDVELRLVLVVPYQGLRALQHTDVNGSAKFELTKSGSYRIYINTDDYNHPKYVEFEYPSLCPPPPPKPLDISVEADCAAGTMIISAESEGSPADGVFVRTQSWSSVTGKDGAVLLPLEKGDVLISANKSNHSFVQFYYTISCEPPPIPECETHDDCEGNEYCGDGECILVTGECGFAENHSWYQYPCCNDSDCDAGLACVSNFCEQKQLPPTPNISIDDSNITENETGKPALEAPVCPASLLVIVSMASLGIFSRNM